MLRESLAIDVRDAVRRAMATDLPVQVKDLEVHDGNAVRKYTIEVLSLQSAGYRKRCYLVLFVPSGDASAATRREESTEGMAQDEKNQLVEHLRKDLSTTKIYLQSLVEEREVRNQDLIAANEEVQSPNEELQSANEELETTKEEVQSANEELQTVNEELLQVNNVLTQTSNDLSNLLASANIRCSCSPTTWRSGSSRPHSAAAQRAAAGHWAAGGGRSLTTWRSSPSTPSCDR